MLASSPSNALQITIVVIASLLCYYNACDCELVFDDISAIRDNKDLRPTAPLRNVFLNDFWGTAMRKEQSHKSYRPLTVLTFRWNYALHAIEPFGYHLANILLHLGVCLLFRSLCRHFFSNLTSFVATLLFVVHPIHTEAVTGVVGRAELLSSIFYMGAFIFYAKAVHSKGTDWLQMILMGISVLFSMLCKEQGITIAGVCGIYEIFFVQKIHPKELLWYIKSVFTDEKQTHGFLNKNLIKRLSFLAAVTVLALVGRLYVMGSQLPVFTRFDNPASAAPTPQKQLTYSYLIYLNAKLLLVPSDLCCDWTMGTIPLITGFTDRRNFLTLSAFIGLVAIGIRALTTKNYHHSKILIICLAWITFPFLPASNLFFPVGFVIAERVLYMPSMGFCMFVAYGYEIISSNWKRLSNCLLISLLIIHGCKTFQRNEDWKNEYSLFTSGIVVNQNNAKLFNNVGHALENNGKYERALEYFRKAVAIQNDDIGAYINVGRTYNHLKMYKEAEEAYMKAKSLFPKIKPGESYQARIAPNHLNVFINLANLISKNATRLEEADHLYKQAISMRSDYVQAYINRGDILMKLNRTLQAQQVYEKALLYDNENPDIYYNLGVVFLEQGKASQANVYFNKALELNPEHEQALLNSAILLQEMGGEVNRETSRFRLFKLLDKNDDNERVYFNLGMLSMDDGNSEEAENYFKRAIHLKDGFRSALFNLALLLADTNRPLEAIPFLNQLIRHHPDHIKGLILLGDIYINHMKDLDAAESCYKSILKYEPHNIQGLHNLCVVYVERGKFAKARGCLKYAHHLARQEDYILRHLKIVETKLEKLKKLPNNNPEKILAFSDYSPTEFSIDDKSGKQEKKKQKIL